MGINLNSEQLLSFGQAARRLPPFRADRPVSPVTLWRWATRGVRRDDGTRVLLEAVRLGERWITSAEALQRFAVALTEREQQAKAVSHVY